MRKFTFALIMMLGFASMAMAQVIENYEPIAMSIFEQGSTGTVSVVANPDPTGTNTSAYVGKMLRAKDGKRWMGWYATLPTPVDMTANKYVHLKVWKPRVSPTCFKFEKSGGNSEDTYPIADATETGKWVELVFDYSAKPLVTGEYVKIVLIPDFEANAGDFPTLTEDITLYFDDIYVNNDPAVGSAPVKKIEDYEMIEHGAYSDQGTFTMVPNPDKSGVNLSAYCVDFKRLKDAVAWTGFFSHLVDKGYPAVDVTSNHYVHVKFWKPRISNAKFKLEGGTSGSKEFPSMATISSTNKWEDIVFDVSEFTGTYPTIGLLADMSDVALTEDIHIYIDDIRVNNNPAPLDHLSQVFQVDMNGAGLKAGGKVFMVGAIGGKYGTWQTPGSNPENEMFDADGDSIYTIDMQLPDGLIAFKFFKTTVAKPSTWDFGDPFTGGDRTFNVFENSNVIFTWGSGGFETAVKVKPLAGKVNIYPNPVRNELTVNSTADLRSATITSMVGKVVGRYTFNNAGTQNINTSGLKSGMYFVTFIGKDGSKVTQKIVKD